MKKYSWLLLFVFIIVLSLCGCSKKYAIGSKGPAGGYIFYDCDADNNSGNADGLISSECGWRYLEAAPEDLNGLYGWGSNSFSDGNGTGLGDGKSNTEDLMFEIYMISSHSHDAAEACYNYSYGGYKDWFLPSKDELNLMYKNLKKANMGGEWNTSFYYWSSSEEGFSEAWAQNFNNGSPLWYSRSYGFRVRPVRAFK